MELWIRSQDKYTLIKVDNAIMIIDGTGINKAINESVYSIFSNLEQIKEIKDGWIININNLNIGTYKSKERALEVLDEIQKYLTPTIQMLDVTLKDKQVVQVNSISSFVYEMPKE